MILSFNHPFSFFPLLDTYVHKRKLTMGKGRNPSNSIGSEEKDSRKTPTYKTVRFPGSILSGKEGLLIT